MVTLLTRQIFTNIFQMEHILAVKFDMVYEKNIVFSCDTKISKSLKKKLKKLDWAPPLSAFFYNVLRPIV